MPFTRRIRGPVLTFVLLFLALLYCTNVRNVQFQPQNESKSNLFPPPSSSHDEGHAAAEPGLPPPAKPSEDISGQPAPPASSEATAHVDNTYPKSPELSTSASDVLLIFKTGASTIWRRMPLHLTTTLSNGRVPNSVIYSDLLEQLTPDIETVDALANVTDQLKMYDASTYISYLDLKSSSEDNTYREHARLPGDEPPDAQSGNPPGWLLDKYKFLPMLTHAHRNWPGLRWYIYVEDDTFIFLDNILQWLATQSPDDEPSYYGAFSGEGKATFAQGGSGIVFSRALMRSVFGGESGDTIPSLKRYGNYTSKACCGDIVLGKVLRDQGIYVNRGEYGTVSFRPEPPWKTGFDELVWCSPIFTFHHLHQKDLVQLAQLDETRRKSSSPSRPIIFRDIFTTLILPYIRDSQRSHWDNFAAKHILTVNSTTVLTMSGSLSSTAFDRAFESPVTCGSACLTLDSCLSWRHDSASAECALDSVVKLGREVDPLPEWAAKTEVVSGWMMERIEKNLLTERCDVITPP